MLFQSMAEWLIHVAIVSEPYSVPLRANWAGDNDNTVAVIAQTTAGSPPFNNVLRGNGCVVASFEGLAVAGIYFSPNRPLIEFEQFLAQLGTLLGQCGTNRILLGGDFNAKSVAWGCPATDARGEVLMEWATATGMSLINRGAVDTCVRQQGGSIVDLTFASPALRQCVRAWEVLQHLETLSDHRYIRYELSTVSVPGDLDRLPRGGGPRWALKSLDRDVLVEAATVHAWAAGEPVGLMNIEEEARWCYDTMAQICDTAMSRLKPLAPRRRVYWWSAVLSQLREACTMVRRQYLRCRRRAIRDRALELQLYDRYREARKTFRAAIGKAKQDSWDGLLESLNNDPWGRPYKMVRQKLRPWAPPLTQTMQPQLLDQVVSGLFPNRGDQLPPPMAPPVVGTEFEANNVPEVTEAELKFAISKLQAKTTAPGPDGIPGRVWVLALKPELLLPRVRALFNECLSQGLVPRRWKTGKLVLLRKEGRPVDSPSAYRPIVLLDEINKLFERIVSIRLVKHLEGAGPDLNENQFGFRKARSTVDAIMRVKRIAEAAVSRGGVVVAVSLDISNAFNTLPWACIREALRYHRVPIYLCKILEAYLSERSVIYPARTKWDEKPVSCGVPQGSVLGPLLWNIGYDWVLRGANLRGVELTCYADDTLVTAFGEHHREALLLATAGVAQVVGRIRRLGLEVALNKSEALCFHGPRRAPPANAHIVVGGVSIGLKPTMRYLGLVLDGRWKFNEHFRHLAPKLIRAANALGQLLPNVGGPKVSCRRLYTAAVRSMALYGAPIWVDALSVQNRALLRKPQRVMAVRSVRAYATVSCEAACVLAGTPPWDLDAQMHAAVYRRCAEAKANGIDPDPEEIARLRLRSRRVLLRKWDERLQMPSAGHRTVDAIRPVLKEWVGRRHGALTFHLVQVLSGHGCFGRYLHRVARRELTPACHHCDSAEDTAEHTLAVCPHWTEPRADLAAAVGNDLSLPAVVNSMVDSEGSWQTMVAFCETVMSQKEEAERVREDSAESDPIRRRRAGRRRLAHDRRLPP